MCNWFIFHSIDQLMVHFYSYNALKHLVAISRCCSIFSCCLSWNLWTVTSLQEWPHRHRARILYLLFATFCCLVNVDPLTVFAVLSASILLLLLTVCHWTPATLVYKRLQLSSFTAVFTAGGAPSSSKIYFDGWGFFLLHILKEPFPTLCSWQCRFWYSKFRLPFYGWYFDILWFLTFSMVSHFMVDVSRWQCRFW